MPIDRFRVPAGARIGYAAPKARLLAYRDRSSGRLRRVPSARMPANPVYRQRGAEQGGDLDLLIALVKTKQSN